MGYVPAAIYKEGIGNIDFVYGQTGKNGYGLAHIIERRNSEGVDGEQFVRQLPQIIQEGDVISKEGHNDRKYIISKDREIALKLDFNGEKRNWIVSAYIQKELPVGNSFDNRHTMHAHDSNLNVANGGVSIATPITDIITDNPTTFNPNVTNNDDKRKLIDEVGGILNEKQYIQSFTNSTMILKLLLK